MKLSKLLDRPRTLIVCLVLFFLFKLMAAGQSGCRYVRFYLLSIAACSTMSRHLLRRVLFERLPRHFATVLRLSCLIALFAPGSAPAAGQAINEEGFKLYGAFHGNSVESVSLASGHLEVMIPLLSYPQRGDKLGLSFSVHLRAALWDKTVDCTSFIKQPCTTTWAVNDQPPFFGAEGPPAAGPQVLEVVSDPTPPLFVRTNRKSYFYGSDRSTHPFTVISGAANMETVDATGVSITDTSTNPESVPLTIFPDGTRATPTTTPLGQWGTIFEDTNGNQITFSPDGTIADTMGRTILRPTLAGPTQDLSGCTGVLPTASARLWQVPGANGGTYNLKFCYALVHVFTGRFPADDQYHIEPNGDWALLQSIVLPDASAWTFGYSTDGWGDLTKIVYPTGGSVSYTWDHVSGCQIVHARPAAISAVVLTRTVDANDGTGPHQWRYSGFGAQAKVTDPLGNDTVHTFSDFNASCSLYETLTQYYDGPSTGTPIKTVRTDFSWEPGTGAPPPQPQPAKNVVPTGVTTTWPIGQVTKTEYDYDPGFNIGTTQHGIYGKKTAMRVYDYGNGAPGPLLRETDTTYQWQVNSAYLDAQLLDLPASVTVKDVSGCKLAVTEYAYDESGYLTSAAIATQHVAPPNGVRGNPTSITKWLAPASSCNPKGGAAVVTHANWYDTGKPYQTIDPLGHTTTLSYDSAYAGAYVTQTCSPQTGTITHCISGTYDFSTGLLTSLTNENATTQASGNTPGDSTHTSNYSYDFMWRLTTAQAPPDPVNSGVRAQTSFTFSTPNVFPRSVQRTRSITNSLNDSATTLFDGLGRSYQSQQVTPGGTAKTDTSYDSAGQISDVTNPYFTTSDTTYGTTHTDYDALGRPVKVTKQDGSFSTVDYSGGSCTTATDEAGKQRKACSDALGRLIEVDEPGGGTAATQASGSMPVNGTLQSTSVGGHGATQSTGSFTITGTGGQITVDGGVYCALWQDDGYCLDWEHNWITTNDTGTVKLTVGGHATSTVYGYSNASVVAADLAYAINHDGAALVWASASGATVNLQSRASGSTTNYSWSLETSSDDPNDFGQGGSFGSVPGAGSLSGGTNASGGTTVYDAGTVTATAGSFQASIPYGQSTNSTASAVASALAAALNAPDSPVTASASGSSLSINYRGVGAAGNIAITCSSSTSQGTYFSGPSFTCPGVTLSGGLDASPPGLAHPYVTLYSYDTLGNLLRVDQKGSAPNDSTQWRTRTFTYDSFSRLLTATNPESGTISYAYDADGELLMKTGPAPNQTGSATQTVSYCYDELHRVTKRDYSPHTYASPACPITAPVVSYTYDQGAEGKGHLTSLVDQAGAGTYTYDVLGRMATESRTIAGAGKNMSYSYNLNGSIKTIAYPSGSVVTYTPDAAGRMLSAVDSVNGINYATGATYGPDSALTGFVSGYNGAFAGITNSFSYNKRLQPVLISASTPTQSLFSIGYDFHLGNGDNGNVFAITNNRDTSRSQSFTYDALNRLISAQNAGTDCSVNVLGGRTKFWGNSYGYDAWGNLLQKTVTKCSAENLSMTALANNQLAGHGYDAAGNMISDPTDGATLVYDAESRIATATKGGVTTTYAYDADGNRVKKSNGSTGTLYWYMSPGIIAESDLNGVTQSEYVFFDGERVARRDGVNGTGGVIYYFSDHLKTASVITDSKGVIKAESDYYPWGGEIQFVNNDSNHYKFTGKERDIETGLDYFGARYYSNGLGRFITPDWSGTPVPVPYADLDDPQSLNQYSYVRNVPTVKVDLDGHGCPPVCDVPTPTAEDWKLIEEAGKALGAASKVARAGRVAVAVAVIIGLYASSPFIPTVGQSNEEEKAQIEQASRERAAQNGGVDPQQPQLGQGRGADEEHSQSDDAKDKARTNGALVKPARGPGSVPKDQRDPKRGATDKDKAKMRKEQNGNCAHCGEPLGDEKGIGHHDPVRHADGGSEMKLVHEKCHSDLHSCN